LYIGTVKELRIKKKKTTKHLGRLHGLMTAEKEDIINVVPCRELESAFEEKAVEVY